MPRVGEVREPVGDHLVCAVRAVQAVGEHELDRPRFSVAEHLLRNDPSRGRDAKVLEHVEGRVEGAVTGAWAVPHVAVPAAIVELRAQHGLAEKRKTRIRTQVVRAEPEPEPEVAEIDSLQQEGTVDGRSFDHESAEQTLDRRARGRMVFGNPAGDEQQERPDGIRPTTSRPFAVGSAVPQ